jgi:hypothetical protein
VEKQRFGMRKEVKLLYHKAIDSLILSVEMFNRPNDKGRVPGVLIFLDHAMEMFLKAGILHKGGKIRDRRAKQTIGFDACVRRALSDAESKFLTNEQALTLQSINGLRDAAQHYLLDMSEEHLYMQAQAGLTLIRDLTKTVFGIDIRTHLPERVLPLSTTPPKDLSSLFENEIGEIRNLLKPGSRRKIEAMLKLRALSIVEGSVQGEKVQPGTTVLNRLARQIRAGTKWTGIFPGIASLNLTAKGYGPAIDLRITKKKGTPITLVPEGTPGATTVAVRRVDELGFYNMGRAQLAEQVGLTGPKTTAMVRCLKLQNDPECFRVFQIGKSKFMRYSQKAISKIKEALKTVSIDKVWSKYGIGWNPKT